MKDNEIKKELESISSSLAKREKKEGFQVPPGYFDQLTKTVMHRVLNEEESKPEHTPSLFDRLQWMFSPRLTVAIASIVLVVSAFFFLVKPATEDSSLSIASGDYIDYLLDNPGEIDETILVEMALLEDADFNIMEYGTEESDIFIEDILDDINIEDLDNIL